MTGSRRPRRTRHWVRRGGGVALFTVLLGLGGAAPASAHPYLLHSDPASGSVLSATPSRIDIDYTEGLDRAACSVVLVAPDGSRQTTHQVGAGNPSELSVAPDQPMSSAGTYAVQWTAVGDDGHTVIGSFPISIGRPSANPSVSAAAGATSGSAQGPGGIGGALRTLLPFVTVVLVGLLLLGKVIPLSGAVERIPMPTAWTAQVGCLLALAVNDAGSSVGRGAFGGREGHRLLAELLLSLVVLPSVVLRLRPRTRGRAAARAAATTGAAVAGIGLLVLLALSGHADAQPASRRALAVTVYTVHLSAVSLWIGSLVTAVLRDRSAPGDTDGTASAFVRLRPLVAVSLLATLLTGVATTDWGLRTLADIGTTGYGHLVVAKLLLFVAVVALGATALVQGRRGRTRHHTALVRAELVVAAGTLVVAGVLGQTSQPLTQPYPSQTYAATVGLPVSVEPTGAASLDVGELAPGIVGANTFIVEFGTADEQDFLHPDADVQAVTATASCGCGLPDRQLTLRHQPDAVAWSAPVDLPRTGSWLFTVRARVAGSRPRAVHVAQRVLPARLPQQEVIGVPADLTGPGGQTCRDQAIGLQTAMTDVNTRAADRGDLARVVTVDLGGDPSAAVARLRALGAQLIAMPCGAPAETQAAVAAARAAGLPVVLGAGAPTVTRAGVWSTQPDWRAEGAQIASQVMAQAGRKVTAVVGDTAADAAEWTGLRRALAGHGVTLQRVRLTGSSHRLAMRLAGGGSDLLVLLAAPSQALPVTTALSGAVAGSPWVPSHGILASAQLMSTDFINAAGPITRVGGIEFASDINPFDPIAQYYAQRLRTLTPGIRPSFDGVHGYEAGLAVAAALREGGGRPSAGRLTTLLGSRLGSFTAGSYRLGWQPQGGTSTSLAFFRSTYVNPMAMPDNTPGGAAALTHEGTFLDSGGFEQVAPFRILA